MAANNELIESIKRLDTELDAAKHQVKVVKEAIEEELTQLPAYDELQEAKMVVQKKQEELKRQIQDSRELNQLAEDLTEAKFNLKDLRDILSHHLIRWHDEVDDPQFPLDNKTAKPVILSGKLGKAETRQERMRFGE